MNKIFVFLLILHFTVYSQQQQRRQTNAGTHCSFSQIQKTLKTQSTQLASASHIARMGQYDVKFYFLNVNLERTSTYISGKVSIQSQVVAAQLDTFSFELHQNLNIDSVKINGISATVFRSQGEANAILSNPVPQGQMISAEIWYKGTPPSGASAAIGNGISNGTSQSWGNRITWTLSQPYAAYEWWPCKQVLSDKADSVWVFVTTDTSNKVGSNGVLQRVFPVSATKHRYEWKSHYPINYYLISITVGQYVDYSFWAKNIGANNDSILVQNYIYNNPNTLPYFKPMIDTTAGLLRLFSEKFGIYPFYQEKYGHCMAPFSGGMEHQTMTSLGFFTFTLNAHELGHQWFGDYVTCKSWKDIWVNEGFASYCEYLALQAYPQSNETATSWMFDVHDNVMSQPGGSVYVDDTNSVPRIFSSRLSYDKGAAIIHTLRFVVNNDSLFFAGCKNYLQQFAHSSAYGSDFKAVMENTTGLNLTQFFDQWYYGEGYPNFNVKWNQSGNQVFINVNQTTSSANTPLFITPIQYTLKRVIGDTTIRVMHGQQIENYTVNVSGTVTNIIVDPENWIVNTATVSKDVTLSPQPAKQDLSVKIFPNPGNQTMNIQCNENIHSQVVIYDMLGKTIHQSEMNGFEKSIDVQKWPAGIYHVEIQSNKGTFTFKYQKN